MPPDLSGRWTVGRVLRLVLGVVLLIDVAPLFARARGGQLATWVGVTIGLVAGYAAIHLVVSRFVPRLNAWIGAVLALSPVVLVYGLGGPAGRVGSVTFLGISLLVAGWRGDLGCEVMSIPGLAFGRRTHLACLLFSPIDWLERRLRART